MLPTVPTALLRERRYPCRGRAAACRPPCGTVTRASLASTTTTSDRSLTCVTVTSRRRPRPGCGRCLRSGWWPSVLCGGGRCDAVRSLPEPGGGHTVWLDACGPPWRAARVALPAASHDPGVAGGGTWRATPARAAARLGTGITAFPVPGPARRADLTTTAGRNGYKPATRGYAGSRKGAHGMRSPAASGSPEPRNRGERGARASRAGQTSRNPQTRTDSEPQHLPVLENTRGESPLPPWNAAELTARRGGMSGFKIPGDPYGEKSPSPAGLEINLGGVSPQV